LRQYQSAIRPNSPTTYFRFPFPFSVANIRGSKLHSGDDCASTLSSVSVVVAFFSISTLSTFEDCWIEVSLSSDSFPPMFSTLLFFSCFGWIAGGGRGASRGFEDSAEDIELEDSADR